jgi:uncharacterized protein (TIGR02246 family)
MNRIEMLIKATTVLMLAAFANAAAEVDVCAAGSANYAIAASYNARWTAALNAGDSAAVARLYAESAVLMPPTDETFVGRDAIAEYLSSSSVPARAIDYQIDLVSCDRHGDSLRVAGVWGAARSVPHDGTGWHTGNLVRVLQVAGDGDWVLHYEIWN